MTLGPASTMLDVISTTSSPPLKVSVGLGPLWCCFKHSDVHFEPVSIINILEQYVNFTLCTVHSSESPSMQLSVGEYLGEGHEMILGWPCSDYGYRKVDDPPYDCETTQGWTAARL